MFDLGLSQTHTLITGSSGGLGLELVSLFLSQEALVTAHYNSNPAGLDSVPSSPSLVKAQANVEKEEDVERMFVEAREGMGGKGVEVLVGECDPNERQEETRWIGGRREGKRELTFARLNISFVSQPRLHCSERRSPFQNDSRAVEQDYWDQPYRSVRSLFPEGKGERRMERRRPLTLFFLLASTGTFLLVRAFLNQLQFVPEERKHKIAVVFIG